MSGKSRGEKSVSLVRLKVCLILCIATQRVLLSGWRIYRNETAVNLSDGSSTAYRPSHNSHLAHIVVCLFGWLHGLTRADPEFGSVPVSYAAIFH